MTFVVILITVILVCIAIVVYINHIIKNETNKIVHNKENYIPADIQQGDFILRSSKDGFTVGDGFRFGIGFFLSILFLSFIFTSIFWSIIYSFISKPF